MLVKIIRLTYTNKNNNLQMFVVGKIVFMHTQTPDTVFVLFTYRSCRLLSL